MMKKFILVIPFLITCSINIFPQWSTDPNNNLIVGYGLDPKICSDSAGGCYITYDYNSTSYPRWLALERLDKYGYKPWGINKRILGETPEQSGAEIIEDGEGGVIVSYIDRFENLPNWTERVRVQKVDSNGNFLWGTTGVRVSLEEINHGGQELVTDGEGGCVIAWQAVNNTYFINRIDQDGNRLWGNNGITLNTGGSNSQPIIIKAADGNYYLQAATIIYRINQNGEIRNQYSSTTLGQPVPDSQGGVVLSGLVWTGMIPKLVAQRKDSLGNNLWQVPYVEIADSLYYLNARFNIQYNDGYYYYGWSGTKDGIARVAQFQTLRQDGSKLFPQGSIQISNNTPIGRPYIILSDSSRTILVWNDATISSTTFAQIYDTLGNKLWNENGVVVSYPAIAYENTSDGQGGFITMGIINQFTIVAQQVSRYGNLGEVIPVPVELISFTGIADKDEIILSWITVTELNNHGFEVQRSFAFGGRNQKSEWERIGFVPGFGTTTEPKSYSFTDKDVTTGDYKYRLKQIDFNGTFTYSNEVEVAVDFTPKEFLLYQNYPNPFNSLTIIKYQIPNEGRVRIVLYNILGERLKILSDEFKNTGTHSIIFDTDNLPSGSYIYTIETNNKVLTKKLTILK